MLTDYITSGKYPFSMEGIQPTSQAVSRLVMTGLQAYREGEAKREAEEAALAKLLATEKEHGRELERDKAKRKHELSKLNLTLSAKATAEKKDYDWRWEDLRRKREILWTGLRTDAMEKIMSFTKYPEALLEGGMPERFDEAVTEFNLYDKKLGNKFPDIPLIAKSLQEQRVAHQRAEKIGLIKAPLTAELMLRRDIRDALSGISIPTQQPRPESFWKELRQPSTLADTVKTYKARTPAIAKGTKNWYEQP